ncbi:MAG TPA: hypothetical protein VF669_14815 [Tepidisphaeraceae bacterium]
MDGATALISALTGYAKQIETVLGKAAAPPAFTAESAFAVQLERALPQNIEQGSVDRLREIGNSGRLREISVVDHLGHQRPIYLPLMLYAWLLNYRQRFETMPREEFGQWDEALRAWCELLETTVTQRGASTPQVAFSALALYTAGKVFVRDPWTDLAAGAMGAICQTQQADGSLLAPDAAVHPEITWYDELATLHALASYAVQAEDRSAAGAVARATKFHLHAVQPDHATAQPFGLFAFIWNEKTRALADQILHTLQLRQPVSDAASLILLYDCLYCLRLFL